SRAGRCRARSCSRSISRAAFPCGPGTSSASAGRHPRMRRAPRRADRHQTSGGEVNPPPDAAETLRYARRTLAPEESLSPRARSPPQPPRDLDQEDVVGGRVEEPRRVAPQLEVARVPLVLPPLRPHDVDARSGADLP